MCKSLQISIAVLEAASEFVSKNIRIIGVPFIFFLVSLATFICWLAAIICLFSVGEIDNGPEGS
jgi:uncharacterized membrane protein